MAVSACIPSTVAVEPISPSTVTESVMPGTVSVSVTDELKSNTSGVSDLRSHTDKPDHSFVFSRANAGEALLV